VILSNVFAVANRWGLEILLPEPVERQLEEQWLRNVRERSAKLDAAARDMNRFLSAVGTGVRTEHEDMGVLLARYKETVDQIKQDFKIRTPPFTPRYGAEFFDTAIRYILPFETKGEGKGFQDAVILASVLDDLSSHPDRLGVLVSADEVFSKTDLNGFVPGCPSARLKFLTLDKLWEILWDRYWDENVKAPWEEEQRNAMEAMKQKVDSLKEFVESHLTESMLMAGTFQKIIEVRGLEKLEIQYVQTPLPKLGTAPDRTVRFAAALLTQCRVLIEESYPYLGLLLAQQTEPLLPPPPPRQRQGEAIWLGGVEAQANIANRQFQNIQFLSLVSSQELGDRKWWKEHPTPTQNEE
jgi:hypothetical protein